MRLIASFSIGGRAIFVGRATGRQIGARWLGPKCAISRMRAECTGVWWVVVVVVVMVLEVRSWM